MRRFVHISLILLGFIAGIVFVYSCGTDGGGGGGSNATAAEPLGTPISSLPYTVSQPGLYYVTANLSSTGTGVLITSDDVTLDLMGFSLTGPGASDIGIIVTGAHSGIEVRNGIVRNFYEAVLWNDVNGGRIVNVRVMGNDYGIEVAGQGNLIKDCTIGQNTNVGIFLGLLGVRAAEGAIVQGNLVFGNGGSGIADESLTLPGGGGHLVTGNTLHGNGGDGIHLEQRATVIGNVSRSNGGDGIEAGPGSTLYNNTTSDNQQYGINVTAEALVGGSTGFNNNLSAGAFANISACGTCTVVAGQNHLP